MKKVLFLQLLINFQCFMNKKIVYLLNFILTKAMSTLKVLFWKSEIPNGVSEMSLVIHLILFVESKRPTFITLAFLVLVISALIPLL